MVLVTSFTLGHSITLALASLDLIRIPSLWIEFLIPLTISVSALNNFWNIWFWIDEEKAKFKKQKYFIVLFFGLIHGMGFSNFLRSVLSETDSLILPLFAFNVGLELGQIVVVFLSIGLMELWVRLEWKHKYLVAIFSILALFVSGFLMWQRWPF
jgi:hypothetical protein